MVKSKVLWEIVSPVLLFAQSVHRKDEVLNLVVLRNARGIYLVFAPRQAEV